MTNISQLREIKTPPIWKERLDIKISQSEPLRKSFFRKFPIMLAAIITIAVLMAGTALAYALTGGEFFTKFFIHKADTSDYSYMDVSQLSALAGTTIGTVVDTDELRIDVTDVISSGSDAMVALCVTAKQLDSVLLYTGWDEVPLNNYRFGSGVGTLFNNSETYNFRYIYSNEDNSLADNQFYLVYTVISLDGFKDSPYSIDLRSFGYYDLLSDSGTGGSITTVYEGPWSIKLDLSAEADHSRVVLLNQRVDIGKYTYTIEEIHITPFSLTAVISHVGAPDLSTKRLNAVVDAALDLALYTKDGTSLDHGQIRARNGDGANGYPDSTYHLTIDFEVPINVEDVMRLHIFGCDYDVSSEFINSGATASAAAPNPAADEATVPETPSDTAQWMDDEKYKLYDMMLNSIDNYDYVSGTLRVITDDAVYDVSYRVNFLTGETYEEVTDENGASIKIEYSDGETLYLLYPERHEYKTAKSLKPGETISADDRITTDSFGINRFLYRDDGTNTVFAAESSLLPQRLVMQYLSDENCWYFCGSGTIGNRSCVAIRGTINAMATDNGPDMFEMMIDSKTGVILQYMRWDAERDFTESCVTKSLSYDNPGSFSDVKENVSALLAQYQ